MELIRIPKILQEGLKISCARNKKIGFVPTMGAVHNGHISLITRAKEENDIVVVSIFVNPTQFGPEEDYEKYPCDISNDINLLKAVNVDILFIPDVKTLYPEGFSTFISTGKLSKRLCGVFRPNHFQGVATIVCKLFNIVNPDKAYFGQKDFQQTLIIQRMVRDLNLNLEIVICPTIRESDGLAMSSRNKYLNTEERKAATILYKTLSLVSMLIQQKKILPEKIKDYIYLELKKESLVTEIQYGGIYDTETLEELISFKKINLIALSVKIGNNHLIDNIIIYLNF